MQSAFYVSNEKFINEVSKVVQIYFPMIDSLKLEED